MDDTTFARLVNIQSYTDAELKALARQLSEEELEVSKHRRLLHGEIDIVRAEMVRRLRDKHGAGRGIFQDGDIGALTDILSGRQGDAAGAEAEPSAPTKAAKSEPAEKPPARTSARAIHERFRDLSVNVREERLIRYITKQLGEGRKVDAIMTDHYIVTHTNETTRAQLLQNPHVLRAIEDEIKRQFADYDSITRQTSENPKSE